MDNLIDLFKVIELTRSQPQSGYVLSGIKQDELSNLAEHHYLVTFIAWQLCANLASKGANLDTQAVLEFCLIHDLGELFGGDIAMPYARTNPKARELAKAFEAENQKFLSKFFGGQREKFQSLSDEIMDAKTDESIIAKVADYLEVAYYKDYINAFSEFDLELVEPKLLKMIEGIKDPIAKTTLTEFVKSWRSEFSEKNLPQILYG